MATERVVIQFRADGTRVVTRDIKEVGKAADTSATATNFLRRALLTLGGVQILRGAVRVIAEFGQAMSTVRAITRATDDQFELLTATARRLGATTRFSATDAAEGLVFLARAGFTVEQSLGTIEGTLRLAQAGALDLGSAADIASNVLRGFRLNTDQTSRVVDVLALAANRSNTTVQQLGEALKFVGPIASGVGLSLEETVASVSELSNAGLQATLAGTGLRRVISELESPSKKTRREIEILGEKIDRGEISTVGLLSALQRLKDAGVDTGRALEIFGDRGGPAFEVLSSGIKNASDLRDELLKAGGTAERIAQIMDDNLKGALFSVRSAFEELILSFGDLGATSALTGLMRGLATVLRATAANVEILAGALAGLAVLALPKVIAAIKVLTVAVAANPIGLLVVGIGTAIGALIAFSDRIFVTGDGITTLADVANATFEKIGGVLSEFSTVASEFLSGIVENFNSTFADILPTSFSEFGRNIQTTLEQIVGFLSGSFAAIGVIAASPLQSLKALIIGTLNFIIRQFNSFISFVSSGLESLKEKLISFAAAIPGIGADIADGLANINVRLPPIPELTNDAADIGQTAGDAFSIGFDKGIQSVRNTISGITGRAAELAGERAGAAAAAAAAPAGGVPKAAGVVSDDDSGNAGSLREQRKALDELNKSEELATELAGLGTLERERRVEVLQAQQKLLAANVDIESETAKQALAGVEAGARARQVLTERQQILDSIGPSEEQRAIRTQAINELLAENGISQERANKLLAELAEKSEEAGSFVGGLAGAFENLDTSAQALGASIGQALVAAINRASSALADFIVDGLRDVESLKEAISNILKDLAKQIIATIIQLLILKAIQAATGTGSTPTGGGGGIPGTQAGGFVPKGEPRIVGERGPEPFVPTQSGRVLPNQALSQGPPQVNVQVVNVSDPNEIPTALNTPEGESAILNVLRKNRKELGQLTS